MPGFDRMWLGGVPAAVCCNCYKKATTLRADEEDAQGVASPYFNVGDLAFARA